MSVCSMAVVALLLPLAAGSPAAAQASPPQTAVARDGPHDFDFEFGSWAAHVRRRLRPLTGSNDWVELQGTSVVRRVWDGGANLGELKLEGAGTSLEGLSLRLYHPDSRQWSIYWSNRRDGRLGEAMVGGFAGDRGEFYGQEDFEGRAIFVRFVFSERKADSFRIEQAFSDDGGKTWEPNWIATFTRAKD